MQELVHPYSTLELNFLDYMFKPPELKLNPETAPLEGKTPVVDAIPVVQPFGPVAEFITPAED